MRWIVQAGALVALLTSVTAAAAQQPTNILDSYKRAYDLIEAAVAAHGGAEALAAARQIRVTARGHEYHLQQSRRAAPSLDSTR